MFFRNERKLAEERHKEKIKMGKCIDKILEKYVEELYNLKNNDSIKLFGYESKIRSIVINNILPKIGDKYKIVEDTGRKNLTVFHAQKYTDIEILTKPFIVYATEWYDEEIEKRYKDCPANNSILNTEINNDGTQITGCNSPKVDNNKLLRLSLSAQCSELNIDLEEIALSDARRPEDKILNHYAKLGYVGVKCESLAITETLKALMLDELTVHNIFKSRDDACRRYFGAQFEILKRRVNSDPEHIRLQGILSYNQAMQIIDTIQTITKDRYLGNFKEILSALKKSNWQKDLTVNFAEKFYDAMEKVELVTIAQKMLENPYEFCKGWPDLTVIKNNEVLFIEVKVKDKLHKSQLITFSVMNKIVENKFRVCRIVKQK